MLRNRVFAPFSARVYASPIATVVLPLRPRGECTVISRVASRAASGLGLVAYNCRTRAGRWAAQSRGTRTP